MNTEQAIEAFNNRRKVFNDRLGAVDILEVNVSYTSWGVSTICTVQDYIKGIQDIDPKLLSLEDPKVYQAVKGELLNVFDRWLSGDDYVYNTPLNFPRRVGKTYALDKLEKEMPGDIRVIRLDKHRNHDKSSTNHFLMRKYPLGGNDLQSKLHKAYIGTRPCDTIILGDEILRRDIEYIMTNVHRYLSPLRGRIGFIGVCTEPETDRQHRWIL